MTSRQIKARLKKKNITQEELAVRLGASRSAIHFLLKGTLRSARLETGLAKILEVAREELPQRRVS